MAVDPVQTMCWTSAEIQDRIEKEPRLAIALAEYFGRQNLLLRERIMTISKYTPGPRVTLASIQLARTNGTVTETGAIRLTGLTHQSIADYVGTSREIVTSEMNRLRRLGYLTYSRLYTDIYASALSQWLRQQRTPMFTVTQAPSVRAAG